MDIPAFQNLLSLFPQLALRQRRIAQQELAAPHTITSLNTQLRACGVGDCTATVAKCSYASVLPLQSVLTHQFRADQDSFGAVAQSPVLERLRASPHRRTDRPPGRAALWVSKNTAFLWRHHFLRAMATHQVGEN